MGESSLEAELLVHSVRAYLGRTHRLPELVEKPVDWDTVLSLAQSHGVTPLIHLMVTEHGTDTVPADVIDGLQRRYDTNARRNLHLTTELTAILELLEDHDIPVIPYRGSVLAHQVYGDVGLREFTDLDLLLEQDDIPTAKSVLRERGYEPAYMLSTTEGLTDTQEWAYTHFCRDYPLFRERDEVSVELHWRIVSPFFPSSIELDDLWNRREYASIGGRDVPVLSPEDRLLTLSIHGTRHRWERLEWLCDLGLLMERADIDWDRVLGRARANNSLRMVVLGPLLAHKHLGVELPPEFDPVLQNDSTIEAVCEDFRSRLFHRDDRWDLTLRVLQARTIERRRDRLRFWLWWAFYPDRPEIERVAFSRSFVWLYFLLRPARLVLIALRFLKRSLRTGR